MNEKIAELESKIFDVESTGAFEAAKELIAIDPGNPVAKLAMWEEMDDEEALNHLDLLVEAREGLRQRVLKEAPGSIDEDDDATAYALVLNYLASALLFAKDDAEAAVEIARELVNFDDECFMAMGHVVYYVALLELERYDEIAEVTEDLVTLPIVDYARAIALLELGDRVGAQDALFSAIYNDPDLLFYVTGQWEFDDEAAPADDFGATVAQISSLAGEWSSTDDRIAFIIAPAVIFGYLTRRTAKDDFDGFDGLVESMGLSREVSELKKKSDAMFDSGADEEEIDAEMLDALSELLSEEEKD